MSQHGEYTKTQFETDLIALGEIPQGHFSELDALHASSNASKFVKITSNVGGISLMGERRDYDLPHSLVHLAERLPAGYQLAESGLEVSVGGQELKTYNPYGLTAYFPEGRNGEGEAAYYVIDDPIVHDFEPQTRVVTEEQALARVVVDAHDIDEQQGLFIPMPELEHRYLSGNSGQSGGVATRDQNNFNEFLKRQLPTLRASINPYDTRGALRLERPTQHGSVYLNRASFTGVAPVTLSGRAYRIHPSEGHLEKVELTADAEATFTDENRLHLATVAANRQAGSVGDFLSMVPGCRDKHGASMPLRLAGGLSLALALQKDVINAEALACQQVSAAEIIYAAVTAPRDSEYLKALRAELRPELSLAANEDAIRHQARQQWVDVFEDRNTVKPQAVGLRSVALRAGFLRPQTTE